MAEISVKGNGQDIIVQTLDGQGRYISQEELDQFLEMFPEYSPYRLALEIMAYVGLRARDVQDVKLFGELEGFCDNFKELRYRVSKPRHRNGRIRYKLKRRQVPKELAYKLRVYYEHNKNGGFKNNFFFPFKAGAIREVFKKARDKLGGAFKEVYQVEIHPNGKVRSRYRIAPHALRAFYIGNAYRQTGDLVKTQKIIGHSDPKTTAGYIRFNNLKEIDRNIADHFQPKGHPSCYIDKHQQKLGNFGLTEGVFDERVEPSMIDGMYLRKCTVCRMPFRAPGKNRKRCQNCSVWKPPRRKNVR